MGLKETFENIVRFDERLHKLTPEQHQLYSEVVNARKQGEQSFRGRTPKAEMQAWNAFVLDFVEGTNLDLSTYASKPETFEKDRFGIEPCAMSNSHAYSPSTTYRDRGSHVQVPKSTERVFLDSPLGYAMTYQTSKKREVVSVIGFLPDPKRNMLIIDQIQGGNTSLYQQSKEARRARMKFRITPEEILYEVAEALAKKNGMRGIVVRKREFNQYGLTPDRTSPFKGKKGAGYDRVVERAGMLTNLPSAYAVKSLRMPPEKEPPRDD